MGNCSSHQDISTYESKKQRNEIKSSQSPSKLQTVQKHPVQPTLSSSPIYSLPTVDESMTSLRTQTFLSCDLAMDYKMSKKLTKFSISTFEGSLETRLIVQKTLLAFSSHGIDPSCTLFAQSVCPDEINHHMNDFTSQFSQHMGKVFHLGGLAGVPFTGKTGFAAFSGHVPKDGNLFILFAPHIGLSRTGRWGKYSRRGQEKENSACGAAVGAFNICKTHVHCSLPHPLPDPHDPQMNFLIAEVWKHTERILCLAAMKTKENEMKYKYQEAPSSSSSLSSPPPNPVCATISSSSSSSTTTTTTTTNTQPPSPSPSSSSSISNQVKDVFKEEFEKEAENLMQIELVRQMYIIIRVSYNEFQYNQLILLISFQDYLNQIINLEFAKSKDSPTISNSKSISIPTAQNEHSQSQTPSPPPSNSSSAPNGRKLILLGGIQINLPEPISSYFQPLHFEIRSLDPMTGEVISKDLFHETFGPEAEEDEEQQF